MLRPSLGRSSVLALCLVVASSAMTAQTTQAVSRKVSAAVHARAERGEMVPVFITLDDQPHRSILARLRGRTLPAATDESALISLRRSAAAEIESAIAPQQEALVTRLRAAGASRIQRYHVLNLIAADVPKSVLPMLEADASVLAVRPVRRFYSQLNVSVPALGAPAFWNMGQTGAGLAVAVLDTGIDRTHPAFAGRSIVDHVSFAYGQTDSCFSDNAATGNDVVGHGTHVAGIIGSAGAAGCPNCIGVAKGISTIYNLKIGYKQNGGTGCTSGSAAADMRDVLDAIQWALTNTPALIFNFSFGSDVTPDDPSDTTDLDSIMDLYGAVFVAAGGNGSPGSACRVSTPADMYNGLGVASWDSRGVVSSFSCYGPSLDNRKKPDITAPGRNILSACASAATCDSTGFIYKSGTSMATPHIAGSAALIWPALPGLPNRARALAVRALLLNSTDNQGWAADRGWGFANLTTLSGQLNVLTGVLPQTGSYQFFRGTASTGAKTTLTWNRHVQAGAALPLSNLDLFLYSRTNSQLAASQNTADNVEQVVSGQAADAVVKVKAVAGSNEQFAVAFTNAGFTAATGPILSLTCTVPAGIQPGASFTVACTAINSGDLESFAPAFTLSPLNGVANSGQMAGTINPGTNSKVSWTLTAPAAAGTYNLTASVTSNSFGETFNGTANIAVQVTSPIGTGAPLVTKAGVFRAGLWLWDSNGSGLFEGLGPGQDTAFYLGQAGDVALIGDWNGSGTKKAGVYRNGLWVLDYNGNNMWDGLTTDRAFSFGQPGDQPIVGDWTGDGRDKLGIFRNGVFYLDATGNGTFSRTVVLGQAGDIAVAGDWNGSGTKKVGVFRGGLWVVDYNGNGVWDGLGADRAFFLGGTGDIPVLGDWNGDGRAKAGVFRNGLWVLDYNGNGLWDGTGTDRAYFGGQAGDTPVVGDWTGTGTAKVGYFHAGSWRLDTTGDGSFTRPVFLGQAGDTALTGR